MYWKENKAHQFTVRIAYQVARKLKKVDEAEHSWAQVDKRMWNKLWKLDIPPKVSNFVWRACLDILLTCANLFCRTIPIDSKCVICGQAKEMVSHAL